MFDRREPMGDDDRRLPLHEGLERFLYLFLCDIIEGTRGFIEYEYLRILEEESSDRESLFLSSREFESSFSDDSL